MYLSLIILPFLGCLASGFFGRKIGVQGAQFITILGIVSTTILAILAFFEVGFNNSPVSVTLFRWVDSEWFDIKWSIEFDSLTVSMLIPVLIISSLVHIYSVSYMSNDPHIQRFFSYLSLFTFMMVILVTANNYLLMFVGWEGVGVCSYLLVSFWFTRIAANQSSMSAFLTNRVGDCFLTIGMFAILWSLGNLDYATVFSLAPYINVDIITIIGICLLIGAMAKSSQLGLHVWLPMAMEGPTPVSALIHAATMVTAGVYLLIRSSPLLEYSSTVLLLCLWLGALTTVFSSLIGLFQLDIKKVIAYSTMSQLGMMVVGVGLSSYPLALYHLVNHAFYKGLLFLGAGSIIHSVGDIQDFRKYGGLIKFLPLTYSVILIASLSLAAFPFMTGFYSKDFILESAFGQFTFSSISVYYIAVIGAIFTTLYSVKVIVLTFLTTPNGNKNYYTTKSTAHEGNIYMTLPLVVLAIFSIFFGFITKDIFIGLGSSFFIDNSIYIHPTHEIMINTEFAVSTFYKLLPFAFTILFTGLAIIYMEFLPENVLNFKLSKLGYTIFGFFNQRFLVEFFYNKYITSLTLELGGQTTRTLDKGSVEWSGPLGIARELTKVSKYIVSLNTSVVTNYGLYIVIGLLMNLLIFFYNFVFTMFMLIIPILILLIVLTRASDSSESLSSANLESRIPIFDFIELPIKLVNIWINSDPALDELHEYVEEDTISNYKNKSNIINPDQYLDVFTENGNSTTDNNFPNNSNNDGGLKTQRNSTSNSGGLNAQEDSNQGSNGLDIWRIGGYIDVNIIRSTSTNNIQAESLSSKGESSNPNYESRWTHYGVGTPPRSTSPDFDYSSTRSAKYSNPTLFQIEEKKELDEQWSAFLESKRWKSSSPHVDDTQGTIAIKQARLLAAKIEVAAKEFEEGKTIDKSELTVNYHKLNYINSILGDRNKIDQEEESADLLEKSKKYLNMCGLLKGNKDTAYDTIARSPDGSKIVKEIRARNTSSINETNGSIEARINTTTKSKVTFPKTKDNFEEGLSQKREFSTFESTNSLDRGESSKKSKP